MKNIRYFSLHYKTSTIDSQSLDILSIVIPATLIRPELTI